LLVNLCYQKEHSDGDGWGRGGGWARMSHAGYYVDAAAQAEQDVAQRRCKGKVTADASSSCAAGVSCSGAIARGTTDSSVGVEVAAKDGKSANCCVNPLNLVAY